MFKKTTLISGDSAGIVKIWNMKSYQCIQTLIGHTRSITCLLFYTPEVLASSSRDGTIKFWDMNTWRCKRSLEAHEGGVEAMGISLGALVTIGEDKKIKFWGGW